MKRCYRETRGWRQREEGRWWSVSGLSASAARGENNVWCGRCNLLCWWHCLKNSGKKKGEVNFCGRYQSWRAPWIVIESSTGNKIASKPITAVWEGGKGLFFSLCFLRGGLLIELCKLPGCRPPPAVISSDVGSNNHATNHLGSSLSLPVDCKERVGLSQHQCWFTAPGSLCCPHADLCRLCGFVCQEMRAARGTWPDAQRRPDYHWASVRSKHCSQGRSHSLPGIGRSHRGRCPLTSEIYLLK